MKPVRTKQLRAILIAKGCVLVGTEGSHEKWQTPGGLSNTIVAAHKEQSAGLARNIEAVFAPEFGPKWLTKELSR
jgi:predicted RNA binding protein YcfA (HicA-like mRNA interferase family)